MYTVQAVEPETIQLTDEAGETITLTHGQVAEGLRLCYALTSNIAQGQEFSGEVWVLDAGHRFWSAQRHLVAMSRVTCAANLKILSPAKTRELFS
jgi:hypothetical protein